MQGLTRLVVGSSPVSWQKASTLVLLPTDYDTEESRLLRVSSKDAGGRSGQTPNPTSAPFCLHRALFGFEYRGTSGLVYADAILGRDSTSHICCRSILHRQSYARLPKRRYKE